MSMEETGPASPSAQVVGNAFVEQYYHILHQSPGMVHKFYQDTSVLSRADSDGVMTTVTTMKDINEKILSLKYEDYKAEIETADAQESYRGGVIVIVTGCLTGKDHVRRKFTQTFFLAPQDKGYFVLNDVFRILESTSLPNNSFSDEREYVAPETPDTEPVVSDEPVSEPVTKLAMESSNGSQQQRVLSNSENEFSTPEVFVEAPSQSVQKEARSVVDSSASAHHDTSKKSYASIVKVMKSNPTSTAVYVPTGTMRTATANTDQQSRVSSKSASVPEASASASHNVPETSNANEEGEGYSVYVGNLPFNATVALLQKEFGKFGAIKRDGIQVRSSRGFCFGFVEFTSMTAMQNALKASPIMIGGCEVSVEIKRGTATRVAMGGRGRYFTGSGGFRGNNFRGRGGFLGGGRGYGRSDYRNNPPDYPPRRRGPLLRNVGEAYQRVNHQGVPRDNKKFG